MFLPPLRQLAICSTMVAIWQQIAKIGPLRERGDITCNINRGDGESVTRGLRSAAKEAACYQSPSHTASFDTTAT